MMLPALAALSIAGPAAALQLGPAQVQSMLGQPLRASIAFALHPFEEIAPHCIRVAPNRPPSGLPGPGPASVTIGDGVIHVAGNQAVTDPMLGLQLTIDCPYSSHLSREYVVFVNPQRSAAADLRQAAANPALARSGPAIARASAAPTPKSAIPTAATYRVRIGDTLSGVAERLSGRRAGLWQAAEILFAANPGAFIDGNPNLLRAGALLRIPDALYTGAAPAVVQSPGQTSPVRASTAQAPSAPTSTAQGSTTQAPTAYAGYVPDPAAAREAAGRPSVPRGLFRDSTGEATVTPPAETTIPPRVAAPPEGRPGTRAEPPAAAPDAAPRPGDVRVDAEGLFVSPIDVEEASGAAPDAGLFIEPASDTPKTSAAPAALQREKADSGRSWLWLAGSGVAMILGLLLFGRTLRGRKAGMQALGESFARRGHADVPYADAELEGDETKVDFRFDEGDADARIVRVDADLDDGSGFQESGDIDIAQDFGFSASGGLELGLDVDRSEESPATLTPARPRREGDVIVEREIPPGDPAMNEYDVSMIVDATRQPLDDADDTEKDLHAIELEDENDDADPEEDPFTLSREVDYKILEQDYEDELTATQALAAELSDAARDLEKRLYDPSGKTGIHELPTVEMPAPGTESTVDMPARATRPTAEMPAAPGAGLTAELPRAPGADESRTVELSPESGMAKEGNDTGASEELAILPDAGNDPSAELEIESATIDTKKLKAS